MLLLFLVLHVSFIHSLYAMAIVFQHCFKHIISIFAILFSLYFTAFFLTKKKLLRIAFKNYFPGNCAFIIFWVYYLVVKEQDLYNVCSLTRTSGEFSGSKDCFQLLHSTHADVKSSTWAPNADPFHSSRKFKFV